MLKFALVDKFEPELYTKLLPGAYCILQSDLGTYHRAVVKAEDLGFEIRDCIQLLGSKLSFALLRKPLGEKTVVKNVLKHGTGGLNIDVSRVGTLEVKDATTEGGKFGIWNKDGDNKGFTRHNGNGTAHAQGRFPANVLLLHHPECVQDGVKEVKSDGHHTHKRQGKTTFSGKLGDGGDYGQAYGQKGQEIVENWICHFECAVRLLGEQSSKKVEGRFPANVLLIHKPDCVLKGVKQVKGGSGWASTGSKESENTSMSGRNYERQPKADAYQVVDGQETVADWDCSYDCAVRLLGEQSGQKSNVASASRFFKQFTSLEEVHAYLINLISP